MEGKKILLILVLFLGVSLAEEVPGLFRDKSVPDKLGLSPWKKYKARDQHKSEDTRTMNTKETEESSDIEISEDTRTMNTKETEESSDIEIRHKLPSQDTAWFSQENDDVKVTPYCHSKSFVTSLEKDGSWTPVDEKLYETICYPTDDLPSDQIAIIDDVVRQKCETQYPQYYCFTKEEKVTVYYKKRKGRAYELEPRTITQRTGCVCASPGFKKR